MSPDVLCTRPARKDGTFATTSDILGLGYHNPKLKPLEITQNGNQQDCRNNFNQNPPPRASDLK